MEYQGETCLICDGGLNENCKDVFQSGTLGLQPLKERLQVVLQITLEKETCHSKHICSECAAILDNIDEYQCNVDSFYENFQETLKMKSQTGSSVTNHCLTCFSSKSDLSREAFKSLKGDAECPNLQARLEEILTLPLNQYAKDCPSICVFCIKTLEKIEAELEVIWNFTSSYRTTQEARKTSSGEAPPRKTPSTNGMKKLKALGLGGPNADLNVQTADEANAINNLIEKTPTGLQCLVCGFTNLRMCHMKTHIRTHTGSKPFRCQGCNRAFHDRSNCNKHARRCAANLSLIAKNSNRTNINKKSQDVAADLEGLQPVEGEGMVEMQVDDYQKHCSESGRQILAGGYTESMGKMENGESSTSVNANPPNQEDYSCTECDLTFDSAEAISRHALEHSFNRDGKNFNLSGENVRMDLNEKSHEEINDKIMGEIGSIFNRFIGSNNTVSTTEPTSKRRKVRNPRPKCVSDNLVREVGGNYECTICHYTSSLPHTLTHARKHTGERPYVCKFCGKTYADSSNFYRHENKHEENGDLPQDISDNPEAPGTSERRPESSEQSKNPFLHSNSPIILDSASGSDEENSNTHLASHTSEKKNLSFECSLCTNTFENADALTEHIRQHMEKRNLHQLGSPTQKALQRSSPSQDDPLHQEGVETTQGARRTKRLSSSSVGLPSDISDHDTDAMSQAYSESLDSLSIDDGDPTAVSQQVRDSLIVWDETRSVYKCAKCSYYNYVLYNLRKHIRTHTGEKPFKCEYCDRRFSDKSNRRKHERKHNFNGDVPVSVVKPSTNSPDPAKPFQCDICKVSFRYEGTLKKHRELHDDQKTFVCEKANCGKKFFSLFDLQRHESLQCKNSETSPDLVTAHSESPVGGNLEQGRKENVMVCDDRGVDYTTISGFERLKSADPSGSPTVVTPPTPQPPNPRTGRSSPSISNPTPYTETPMGDSASYLTIEHTEQNTFQCLVCSYESSQYPEVVSHQYQSHYKPELKRCEVHVQCTLMDFLIDLGAGNYKCKICDYQADMMIKQRAHLREVHGAKVKPLSVKVVQDNVQKNRIMRKDPRSVYYECLFCFARHKAPKMLAKHVKNKHPEEYNRAMLAAANVNSHPETNINNNEFNKAPSATSNYSIENTSPSMNNSEFNNAFTLKNPSATSNSPMENSFHNMNNSEFNNAFTLNNPSATSNSSMENSFHNMNNSEFNNVFMMNNNPSATSNSAIENSFHGEKPSRTGIKRQSPEQRQYNSYRETSLRPQEMPDINTIYSTDLNQHEYLLRGRFTCHLCSKVFPEPGDLQIHFGEHCLGQIYPFTVALRNEAKKQGFDDYYSCLLCGATYLNSLTFEKHRDTHRSEENEVVPISQSPSGPVGVHNSNLFMRGAGEGGGLPGPHMHAPQPHPHPSPPQEMLPNNPLSPPSHQHFYPHHQHPMLPNQPNAMIPPPPPPPPHGHAIAPQPTHPQVSAMGMHPLLQQQLQQQQQQQQHPMMNLPVAGANPSVPNFAGFKCPLCFLTFTQPQDLLSHVDNYHKHSHSHQLHQLAHLSNLQHNVMLPAKPGDSMPPQESPRHMASHLAPPPHAPPGLQEAPPTTITNPPNVIKIEPIPPGPAPEAAAGCGSMKLPILIEDGSDMKPGPTHRPTQHNYGPGTPGYQPFKSERNSIYDAFMIEQANALSNPSKHSETSKPGLLSEFQVFNRSHLAASNNPDSEHRPKRQYHNAIEISPRDFEKEHRDVQVRNAGKAKRRKLQCNEPPTPGSTNDSYSSDKPDLILQLLAEREERKKVPSPKRAQIDVAVVNNWKKSPRKKASPGGSKSNPCKSPTVKPKPPKKEPPKKKIKKKELKKSDQEMSIEDVFQSLKCVPELDKDDKGVVDLVDGPSPSTVDALFSPGEEADEDNDCQFVELSSEDDCQENEQLPESVPNIDKSDNGAQVTSNKDIIDSVFGPETSNKRPHILHVEGDKVTKKTDGKRSNFTEEKAHQKSLTDAQCHEEESGRKPGLDKISDITKHNTDESQKSQNTEKSGELAGTKLEDIFLLIDKSKARNLLNAVKDSGGIFTNLRLGHDKGSKHENETKPASTLPEKKNIRDDLPSQSVNNPSEAATDQLGCMEKAFQKEVMMQSNNTTSILEKETDTTEVCTGLSATSSTVCEENDHSSNPIEKDMTLIITSIRSLQKDVSNVSEVTDANASNQSSEPSIKGNVVKKTNTTSAAQLTTVIEGIQASQMESNTDKQVSDKSRNTPCNTHEVLAMEMPIGTNSTLFVKESMGVEEIDNCASPSSTKHLHEEATLNKVKESKEKLAQHVNKEEVAPNLNSEKAVPIVNKKTVVDEEEVGALLSKNVGVPVVNENEVLPLEVESVVNEKEVDALFSKQVCSPAVDEKVVSPLVNKEEVGPLFSEKDITKIHNKEVVAPVVDQQDVPNLNQGEINPLLDMGEKLANTMEVNETSTRTGVSGASCTKDTALNASHNSPQESDVLRNRCESLDKSVDHEVKETCEVNTSETKQLLSHEFIYISSEERLANIQADELRSKPDTITYRDNTDFAQTPDISGREKDISDLPGIIEKSNTENIEVVTDLEKDGLENNIANLMDAANASKNGKEFTLKSTRDCHIVSSDKQGFTNIENSTIDSKSLSNPVISDATGVPPSLPGTFEGSKVGVECIDTSKLDNIERSSPPDHAIQSATSEHQTQSEKDKVDEEVIQDIPTPMDAIQTDCPAPCNEMALNQTGSDEKFDKELVSDENVPLKESKSDDRSENRNTTGEDKCVEKKYEEAASGLLHESTEPDKEGHGPAKDNIQTMHPSTPESKVDLYDEYSLDKEITPIYPQKPTEDVKEQSSSKLDSAESTEVCSAELVAQPSVKEPDTSPINSLVIEKVFGGTTNNRQDVCSDNYAEDSKQISPIDIGDVNESAVCNVVSCDSDSSISSTSIRILDKKVEHSLVDIEPTSDIPQTNRVSHKVTCIINEESPPTEDKTVGERQKKLDDSNKTCLNEPSTSSTVCKENIPGGSDNMVTCVTEVAQGRIPNEPTVTITCTLCSVEVYSKTEFLQHLQTHLWLRCPSCPSSFKDISLLHQHFDTDH